MGTTPVTAAVVALTRTSLPQGELAFPLTGYVSTQALPSPNAIDARLGLATERRGDRGHEGQGGQPVQRCQLDEELIEPGRRDDLQQPRRAVRGVPERVGLTVSG